MDVERTAGVLLFAWNYIPQGVDDSPPYITPLEARDRSGLPPTLPVTNGFDPLRDVGHAYARKPAAAKDRSGGVRFRAFYQ